MALRALVHRAPSFGSMRKRWWGRNGSRVYRKGTSFGSVPLNSPAWPVAFQDEGGNGDSLCFTVDADIDGDGNREWRSLLVGDAEHEEVFAGCCPPG